MQGRKHRVFGVLIKNIPSEIICKIINHAEFNNRPHGNIQHIQKKTAGACIFCVFQNVSGGCKCRCTPSEKLHCNSDSSNPLARLRGHFEAGERERKREGRNGERKGKKGGTPPPPPRNKFLDTALLLCHIFYTVVRMNSR